MRRELQPGVRRGVESAEQRRSPRPSDFWKWTSFGCEVDQLSRPFWLLWHGAGRVAGGVVETIQRIYILATTYIQGAVGEVFTRHGGARGGWRSVGIMGRGEG